MGDHKKFEFMLEKLDLVYKPRPLVFERTDNRRKMGEKLSTLLYHEIKVHKMLTFRDELEKQQPEFLRKKAKVLAKIKEDEENFNLNKTVTQKEIAACLKEANNIENLLENDTRTKRKYNILETEKAKDWEHKYRN